MDNEVEYLKEHLYEIYKYKKSMKDLTYDMDLEHLLRTCKALDYLQEENKKLSKQHLATINKLIETQDKIKQYVDPEDLTLFYMWLDEKAKDKMKKQQEVC